MIAYDNYDAPGGGVVFTETVGTVALTNGQSNVELTWNMAAENGNVQTLTLSGLTQTGAATVTFSARTTGLNTSTNIIKVSGAAQTPAGQIIGPWATTGDTYYQTDYAIYDASSRILPAGLAASAENTWTTGANVTLSAGTTLTGTRTLNTLRYTGNYSSLALVPITWKPSASSMAAAAR